MNVLNQCEIDTLGKRSTQIANWLRDDLDVKSQIDCLLQQINLLQCQCQSILSFVSKEDIDVGHLLSFDTWAVMRIAEMFDIRVA